MSASDSLAFLTLCGTPLFLATTIWLVILYYQQGQRLKAVEAEKEQIQAEQVQLLAEKEQAQRNAISLERQYQAQIVLLNRQHQEQTELLDRQYQEQAKEKARRAVLQQWLSAIAKAGYRNEVEVEVKFVFPLLQWLGYRPDQIDVRVPVSVQIGRQQVSGEADWVLWGQNRTGRRARAIIEAKAPIQPLDETVQDQGRSYAYALKCSLYLLTNGKQIQVYRRNIADDDCLLDIPVSELGRHWEELVNVMGATTPGSSGQFTS